MGICALFISTTIELFKGDYIIDGMTVSIRKLLDAGVHFGHQTRRWNPKMRPYIYGERNGVYIFDLSITIEAINRACKFAGKASKDKKNIVFVGTKKNAADIVEDEARRCGAFFINRRWLGGTLTNFETIRLRIARLKELEEMKENGDFFRRSKKEQAKLNRELTKLDKSLGGIKNMRGRPEVLFIIDSRREHIAVQEAKKTGTTVIGIIDTNCDPDGIDYLIPGNDDSIRSIKLICGTIADAILDEGTQGPSGSDDDDPDSGPDTHPTGVPRVPYPILSRREIAIELEEQHEEQEE